MTRLALLSVLLVFCAACGANQASNGTAASVALPSSGPVLVVENNTGYNYEIFVSTIGAIYGGRSLGTVDALQATTLPLVDVPSNRYVWFSAGPIGAATAGIQSGRMEFAGQRQLKWSLRPDRSGRINAILSAAAVESQPSGDE